MNEPVAILLVEDDSNDVFLLQRAFKEAGIEKMLRLVRDGQEAIEYFSGAGQFADRARHPLPCLVILDLKMPRKNGLDVLRWLREQPVLYSIPVIVFSSSAQRYDVERAYRLGANAFVVKPPMNDDRRDFALHVKGFWLRFNEPPLLCSEGLEAAKKFHARSEGSPADSL